ncbi:hypothetical protein GCM10009007_15540 [Formosimonas limnophila]|uniref:FAD-binding domain-containing protein n=1 Tax=Formosimonas limnophila TaxID=1384487 RepID=A0A8J3CHS7_9BURK|nr:FAD-dependent monooxygenase [Formosimonas limnophila]GHA75292.1 hypothetical protein GCM10009007_15540 [Formosimonas limnophila]
MSQSKLSDLSVAVVGGGIAGAVAALMLGRLGARVTLFEQVPEPRAVGAGILLQPTGLAVLRAIDEGIEAELEGARIVQLLGHTPSGRVVLDSQYRFWREGSYGLGIHRGALFDALRRRLRGLPNVTVRTGVTVVRVEQSELGTVLFDGEDNFSKCDVVVLAEGVNSKLRGQLNIPYSAKPYPWGAFYAILPSVASLPQDVLLQRYEAARKMTGFADGFIWWAGDEQFVLERAS